MGRFSIKVWTTQARTVVTRPLGYSKSEEKTSDFWSWRFSCWSTWYSKWSVTMVYTRLLECYVFASIQSCTIAVHLRLHSFLLNLVHLHTCSEFALNLRCNSFALNLVRYYVWWICCIRMYSTLAALWTLIVLLVKLKWHPPNLAFKMKNRLHNEEHGHPHVLRVNWPLARPHEVIPGMQVK